MRLATAHRILIATFVGFSIFLGVVEVVLWRRTDSATNLAMAALSLAAAVGFGMYLRRLPRQP